MKRNGNVNTNRTFNPQNTKPPIPLDVDEVDAVLERFIRQKYDQQLFSGGRSRPAVRNDTGSTRSSEGEPPPLPPKPAKRFGFGLRSASSILPMQRSLPATPPLSPSSTTSSGRPASPIRVNKQSRVFGASVGGGGGELEAKLMQLRDMGFPDEKKNAEILKGLSGNLERTIESLVRLGEGSAPASRSKTPIAPRNVAVSQPLLPPPETKSTGVVNGISFATNGTSSQPSTGGQRQSEPQYIDSHQAQQTRNFTSPNPYPRQSQPYNPFDNSNQEASTTSLENSFQSMQLSPQPLFPNATGGYPSQPQPQELRLQTMTPPVPQMPHQYIHSNLAIQSPSVINSNYNPFFPNSNPQSLAPSNHTLLNVQPQNNFISNNPYQSTMTAQSPVNGYSSGSFQPYPPEVQQGSPLQHNFQQQAPQQSFVPQAQIFSDPSSLSQSYAGPAQNPTYNQAQQAQQHFPPQSYTATTFQNFQPQALQPQQTGRIDKSSILNLYNYPQLAPPPISSAANSSPLVDSTNQNSMSVIKPIQRSVTMPSQLALGSKNPFQTSSIAPNAANSNPPGVFRHTSQESVDVGGFQNGRHSPDAFASLSASFVR